MCMEQALIAAIALKAAEGRDEGFAVMVYVIFALGGRMPAAPVAATGAADEVPCGMKR